MSRVLIAALVALIVSIIIGPRFIEFLRKNEFGQHIREDGPEHHMSRQGTPTMGGLMILFAATIGGLGLTGVITWAEIEVLPISSALMDVEKFGEERVRQMCHDIEDPTFDATAAATHPCMKMRPLHRPPRAPADRYPHCRWAKAPEDEA